MPFGNPFFFAPILVLDQEAEILKLGSDGNAFQKGFDVLGGFVVLFWRASYLDLKAEVSLGFKKPG